MQSVDLPLQAMAEFNFDTMGIRKAELSRCLKQHLTEQG